LFRLSAFAPDSRIERCQAALYCDCSLELISQNKDNTRAVPACRAFRAVYTVQFEGAVYVLHCFQKKSPRGVKTARADVAAVRRRLTMARRDYKERHGKKAKQEAGRGTQLR
jgi:hypothetical protein